MITKIARVAAWLLVLAAIVLTLGPQRSGRTPGSTMISNTAWPSRWSDWHSDWAIPIID